MTARRRIAILLLFTFLFTISPNSLVSADSEVHPSYLPTLKLGGTDAAIRDDILYAWYDGGLVTYDLAKMEQLGKKSLSSSPAVIDLIDNRLYVASRYGDLLIYDVANRLPQLIRSITVDDFTPGQWNSNDFGPIKRFDQQRLLWAAFGTFYLINETSGATEWSHQATSTTPVDDYQLLNGHIVFAANNNQVMAVKVNGSGQVFSTAGYNLSQVADDTTIPTALYYVSRAGQQINRLNIAADGEIQTSVLRDDLYDAVGLRLRNGRLFYGKGRLYLGEDLATGETTVYANDYIYHPQWFGADDYAFRTASKGVREYRGGKLVWSTSFDKYDYQDRLIAQTETAFVVHLDGDGLWLYTQSGQALPPRQLAYGESHLWIFYHQQQGPISLNISTLSDNPHLYTHVEAFVMGEDAMDWRSLQQMEIDQNSGQAVYRDLEPGMLMILVTAGPTTNWDPFREGDYAKAKLPIIYQIGYDDSLQPGPGRAPKLSHTDPWPALELWGNQQHQQSAMVQLVTEPYQWVYPMNAETPAQADANGNLTLELPIGQDLLSVMQTIAADGDQASLSTIPVLRHWVLQQPGEPPLLSRSPALTVRVPDASAVDLANSEMIAGGFYVPLYADLKNNTIYGVPTQSLYTGEMTVELILAGKATTTGGEPVLLDMVNWKQEIIGQRLAELWPDRRTASINGQSMQLEAAPYIHKASSSTMLPFRFVADVMGAQVGWNATSKQVTFKLDDTTVVLTIGSRTAKVNGKSVTMATAPVIQNGRTMVPLRFVSENLGAFVHWDNAARKVTVKVDEQVFNDLPPGA